MPPKTLPTPQIIDQTIRKNLTRLRKPGVLTVRPGYEIAKHQLTGKAAIVATVHTKRKKTDLTKGELLPDSIGDIPVDVREATPYQRLRAHDSASAELARAYGRPEEQAPTWPLEREMPGGQLLQSPKSNTQRALAQQTAHQTATTRALSAHAKKVKTNYVPANVSLSQVTTTTTITAHVSPDAGLVTLKAFLKATQQSLVIGMYDFTSGPILQEFQSDLVAPKTLQMVLDNPTPNATRNQTDTVTVEDLNRSLSNRAKIARALTRSDPFATEWMFPYAYHIKVIIRDNNAFWLSSGNLNNSNQPDPTSPPTTEDRDWHVIIEDPNLAQTFAAFLNQDYASAILYQNPAPAQTSAVVADAQAKIAAEANPPPPQPLKAAAAGVAAKVFNNITVKITPLLTPDTLPNDPSKGQYLTNITQLISSAQKRLYIQLQYIEASKGTGDYDALLGAIAARVKAGVDVRLIESLEYGEPWAEKMKAQGVDLTANISLQPNVHNKGFVVDSQIVVVSSQNFSPAGVTQNRDAGVIIESQQIAQYFEPIFLSDWNSKAKPFAPKSGAQEPKQGVTKKKAKVAAPAKRPKTAAARGRR